MTKQTYAGDIDTYGATGHVDLFGPQGPDTELKGSAREIETYLWYNNDAQLQIQIWEIDGIIPDERSPFEQLFDWLF